MGDEFYRAFEDRYRGPRELIKSRLRIYLQFVEPLRSIYADCSAVDLGCGRGEWLELMREVGIPARGVDLDEGMLTACRERGLAGEKAEAVGYLRGLPDESVAIVTGFHVAEHIAFVDLQALVKEALRVLKPAGLLILETPNPENLAVGTANFYCDPSHLRPLPPALLSFLPEHYGFSRTRVVRLQEAPGLAHTEDVSLASVLTGVSPDYAVVAQKAASAEAPLEPLDAAFERPFGVSLHDLAARYEQSVGARLAEILSKIDRSFEFEAQARVAEGELAAARHEMAQQDAEIARLEAQAAERGAQIKELEEQAAERAAQIKELEERAAERGAQIKELEERAAERAAQIKELEERAAERAALVERLDARVAALLASASWRVTAPLRLAGSAVLAAGRGWPALKGWLATRFEVLLSASALQSPIRRAALWTLARPRLARPVSSVLQRFPRLFAKLNNIVLFPAATSLRGSATAWQDSTNASRLPRGVLSGTDADIDELLLRIEDELRLWRQSGALEQRPESAASPHGSAAR